MAPHETASSGQPAFAVELAKGYTWEFNDEQISKNSFHWAGFVF
jgi:hypothetical protein